MTARRLFSLGLVSIALWTLGLKFIAPVLRAMEENVSPASYVNWDLWWAVHLALAWQIARPTSTTWLFAVFAGWAEIIIIGVRLALPALRGEWLLFHTAWFANEGVALLFFIALVAYLHGTKEGRDLRNR